MSHIFISYAKKDGAAQAQELHRRLNQVSGLTAWMDISLESGVYWANIIEGEIDKADLLIVLLTPDVNRVPSRNQRISFVLKEVEYAQAAGKSIMVAMAESTKIPLLLTGIHYLDLTRDPEYGLDELVETACRQLGVESPRQLRAREQREAEEEERRRAEAEKERLRLEKLEAERKAEEERLQREAAELAERQRREMEAELERQRRANEEAELRAQNLARAQELIKAGDEYLAVDNWTDALAQYEQARDLIPDDTDLTNRIKTLQCIAQDTDEIILQTQQLDGNKQPDQLIQLKSRLSSLLELLPNSPRLNELQYHLNEQLEASRQQLINTGKGFVAKDNWTEALNNYQTAVRLFPIDAEIVRRIEQLQHIQREINVIRQFFRELVGNPQDKIQQLEEMQRRLTPLLSTLPESKRLQDLQAAITAELNTLRTSIPVKTDKPTSRSGYNHDVRLTPEVDEVQPRQITNRRYAATNKTQSSGYSRRRLTIGGGITFVLIIASIFILPRLKNAIPNLAASASDLNMALERANAGVTTNWQPVSSFFEGVEMVLVPGGCLPTQARAFFSTPITPGICQSAFWIDRYEVTNSTYEPGRLFFRQYSLPRDSVTLNEANIHCQTRGARLPTNAEWEYAALGVGAAPYPWGNQFLPDNVVYAGNSQGKSSVGSKPEGASWVGALDMSGNLWEWVKSPGTVLMNIRGGSWKDKQFYTLQADKGAYVTETTGYDNVGFRCVREISAAAIIPSLTPTWTPTGIFTSTLQLSPIWTVTPVITQTVEVFTDNTTIKVKGSNDINIRSGPGTDYATIGAAQRGVNYPVIARLENAWYLIEANGTQGWVAAYLVNLSPSNANIPATLYPTPAPGQCWMC